MMSDIDDDKRNASTWHCLCGIVGLCVLALALLPSCHKREEASTPTTPSAPDLSQCTRIEIQYRPSALARLCTVRVLTPPEIEYLKSVRTLVGDDQEHIKAFARDVSLGSYSGTGGAIGALSMAYVVCYRNNEHLASLTLFGPCLLTDDGHWFNYPETVDLRTTLDMLAPEVRPFVLRGNCARNLGHLHTFFASYSRMEQTYAALAEWSDVVVRDFRWTRFSTRPRERQPGPEPFKRDPTPAPLKCPGGGNGKCHYAMNPNCSPSSPPDMVLLFETNAGWNQRGGPELFTFDNHDPRGGCVLLNDGTVKFIRTEEELGQLRWK